MRTLICSIIFSLITFPLLAADRETTRQMQILLNSYGFSAGVADGAIGPKTRAAIASAYEATGGVWDGTLKVSDITHLLQLLRQSNYAPKAGIFIENNKSQTLLFPPENPSITHTKYVFGRFWVQADWNQDGLEDYLLQGRWCRQTKTQREKIREAPVAATCAEVKCQAQHSFCSNPMALT